MLFLSGAGDDADGDCEGDQMEEGMILMPTKTEVEKKSRREGERRGAVVFGAFLCRKFNFLLKNCGLF